MLNVIEAITGRVVDWQQTMAYITTYRHLFPPHQPRQATNGIKLNDLIEVLHQSRGGNSLQTVLLCTGNERNDEGKKNCNKWNL